MILACNRDATPEKVDDENLLKLFLCLLQSRLHPLELTLWAMLQQQEAF